jgi:hypothetical protein
MTDQSNGELTIARADLQKIIEGASFVVPDRTRERLRRLAAETPVAFGWFHCDGIECPARQVGYRSMAFQTSYDSAMARHFGLAGDWEDGSLSIKPRVVRVVD